MTNINNKEWTGVPEDLDKLVTIKPRDLDSGSTEISELIREDKVVLVQNITAIEADNLMQNVSSKLKLYDSLQLQTAFAKTGGHRKNIGKYYMSVNQRDNYEYITAHSEGGSFSNVQLASFFCYENSTDGGENIFMNVNESSDKWSSLREHVVRAKTTKKLSNMDAAKVRFLYHITLPKDLVKEDDIVIKEFDSDIGGLKLAEVLTKLKKTYSVILDRELYVYWDTVGSVDLDAGHEYVELLKESNMLRKPNTDSGTASFDYNTNRGRRVWGSGLQYSDLFSSKLTKKLMPGDFVIMNNLTWTHSATNWTPGSGVRKITAAFA